MAKAKRGRNIKKAGWRGQCPICERTGVKLLWEAKNEQNESLNVCKKCGK